MIDGNDWLEREPVYDRLYIAAVQWRINSFFQVKRIFTINYLLLNMSDFHKKSIMYFVIE